MNSKELNLAIKIMTTKPQSLRVYKEETYTLYSEALKLELSKGKNSVSTTLNYSK